MVDSVIAKEPVATFPFTDLAAASRIQSSAVDDLLGHVSGNCDPHIPGRIVLALIRRQLKDGTLTAEVAVKFAKEIGFAAPLTATEYYKADVIDDSLWLATSGNYGTLDDVNRQIQDFLDTYEEFDPQIPIPPSPPAS